jgi:hypothetical protein
VEPVCVYEHDLYVTKRMRDPNDGDVVVIKVHTDPPYLQCCQTSFCNMHVPLLWFWPRGYCE